MTDENTQAPEELEQDAPVAEGEQSEDSTDDETDE